MVTAIVSGQQLAVEVITNICCPTEGQLPFISLNNTCLNSGHQQRALCKHGAVAFRGQMLIKLKKQEMFEYDFSTAIVNQNILPATRNFNVCKTVCKMIATRSSHLSRVALLPKYLHYLHGS